MNINWTQSKLKKLKARYELAVKYKEQQFTLHLEPEGDIELIVGYAKYLIEYLEKLLK